MLKYEVNLMRATKTGSILVVLLFSAVLVSANFCTCVDPLTALEMGPGHADTTSGQPCGEESKPPSHCSSHYFHTALGNFSSLVFGKIGPAPKSAVFGGGTTLLLIAIGAPAVRFTVKLANPARASRPISILNVTLLL